MSNRFPGVVASICVVVLVLCGKPERRSNAAPALRDGPDSSSVLSLSPEEDSLRNTDVVDIVYSTYLSEGNDGKGPVVGVFMIKSNGAGKRELGRVKYLTDGPLYLKSLDAFVFAGGPLGMDTSGAWLYFTGKDSVLQILKARLAPSRFVKSEDERFIYMFRGPDVYRYDVKSGRADSIYITSSFHGERIGSDGRTLLTTGRPSEGNAMEVIRHDMVTGKKEAVIPGDKSVWKYWFSGDLKVFFGNISPFKGDTTKIFTGRIDDRGSWKKRVINTGGYNIFHTGRLDRNGKYYYAWDGMFFSRIKVSDCVFRRLFRTDRVIGKFTLAE